MAVTWREKLVAFNPAPILEAIADLAKNQGFQIPELNIYKIWMLICCLKFIC